METRKGDDNHEKEHPFSHSATPMRPAEVTIGITITIEY